VVVPDAVTVAMSEIAADVREGLLAIAVGAGLQVMAAMMAADVEALCGPRGRHDPQRTATRYGSEDGSVTLGGHRVPVPTQGDGDLHQRRGVGCVLRGPRPLRGRGRRPVDP